MDVLHLEPINSPFPKQLFARLSLQLSPIYSHCNAENKNSSELSIILNHTGQCLVGIISKQTVRFLHPVHLKNRLSAVCLISLCSFFMHSDEANCDVYLH